MQAMSNRMVRTQPAKYWIDANGEEPPFDDSTGPHELRNVAQSREHASLRDELRVRLNRKVINARDPLPERIRPY